MKHSFARRATKLPLISLLLYILLSGCNRGKENQLPKSTGMPYEVVLEGDTDSIVTKMLTEDVTGLPQPEPLCRLIQVKKGKTRGNYLLVRTRIVVNIGERDSESRDFSVTLHHDLAEFLAIEPFPQLLCRSGGYANDILWCCILVVVKCNGEIPTF